MNIPIDVKNKIVAEANWRSTNGHGGVDDITRENFILAAEWGYGLAHLELESLKLYSEETSKRWSQGQQQIKLMRSVIDKLINESKPKYSEAEKLIIKDSIDRHFGKSC